MLEKRLLENKITELKEKNQYFKKKIVTLQAELREKKLYVADIEKNYEEATTKALNQYEKYKRLVENLGRKIK